jgi:hypothetical protein
MDRYRRLLRGSGEEDLRPTRRENHCSVGIFFLFNHLNGAAPVPCWLYRPSVTLPNADSPNYT